MQQFHNSPRFLITGQTTVNNAAITKVPTVNPEAVKAVVSS